jgi:RNA polymerase sigma-70 factor, ECF subfamily
MQMHPTAAPREFQTGCHHPTNDDVSVVCAARGGDRDAFNILAGRHRKRILNLVRHRTRNYEEAEDLAQRVLLKAFLKIGGFRGESSFSTWLTRIAINEALMWKRELRRRAEVSWHNSVELDELGIMPDFPDMRPSPEQSYEQRELRRCLIAAFKGMKPSARLILEICDLNERSSQDLARIQGTSVSAAKSRLLRSRKLLRTKFERLLHKRAAERSGH